jgi:hypothetical protein
MILRSDNQKILRINFSTDQIYSHCPSMSGDVSPRHNNIAHQSLAQKVRAVPVVEAIINSVLVVEERKSETR